MKDNSTAAKEFRELMYCSEIYCAGLPSVTVGPVSDALDFIEMNPKYVLVGMVDQFGECCLSK